jgi:hypothetical protein
MLGFTDGIVAWVNALNSAQKQQRATELELHRASTSDLPEDGLLYIPVDSAQVPEYLEGGIWANGAFFTVYPSAYSDPAAAVDASDGGDVLVLDTGVFEARASLTKSGAYGEERLIVTGAIPAEALSLYKPEVALEAKASPF